MPTYKCEKCGERLGCILVIEEEGAAAVYCPCKPPGTMPLWKEVK